MFFILESRIPSAVSGFDISRTDMRCSTSTYSIMGPLSRPLYKKVKSFPQPAKKQNSSHNPALFRPWISSHKHKKGILDTPVLLCSGMPESLYFKHFSAFHYVFFVIKTTVSTVFYLCNRMHCPQNLRITSKILA